MPSASMISPRRVASGEWRVVGKRALMFLSRSRYDEQMSTGQCGVADPHPGLLRAALVHAACDG
jgi:hypothetical protein